MPANAGIQHMSASARFPLAREWQHRRLRFHL